MAELTKPTTNQPKEDKLSVYEKAVLAEMERRANEGDTLVASALKSEDKNIHDCFRYVTAQAKKKAVSGCAMIEDAVVFGWAHHYYIEPKAVIDAEMKTATKTKTETKPTKPTKATKQPKKEERPKETLENTHVPMVRPKDIKEAKRESKKQASNIIVMDMFAGMWDDDDAEEETTTEQAEEEIDDLPM